MKLITKIISIISLAIAAVSLVLNIRVLFGKSYFVSFGIFAAIRGGGFVGFVGNLLGALLVTVAFAAMGWFGFRLTFLKDEKSRKAAFISGIIVCVIALLSLITVIARGVFSFGDIIMLLFPAVFTVCVIQTTDA